MTQPREKYKSCNGFL